MAFDLTHARHDPAHCLAPGLFRSLKRGDRKKFKLDVVYKYGDKEQIEFSGPEPLGADDLRVLQGLVAMAGPFGIILTPEPTDDAPRQLRLLLEIPHPEIAAAKDNALVVRGSYRQLAHEMGYADDGGSQFRAIRDCLERLWKVSIIVQSGKKRVGCRLLSSYASDEDTGHLFVALNPRLADAILGKISHTRIEMSEVRALSSDPARLMHQRLCGWIDPGKSRRAEMDTLCGYVWPDEAGAGTMRKRRFTIRAALEELRRVGWRIEEYASGKLEISRPAVKPPPGVTVTLPRRNGNAPPA
jgi:hypothetical protein